MREAPDVEVRLWARRAEALEQARSLGIASVGSTALSEIIPGANIVLLCVPLGAMESLVREMLPYLASDALVTDVGSVKAPVCRVLAPLIQGRALFVGSHPMAGSEKAGIAAAKADLFQNATCILTPEEDITDPLAVVLARIFWERLGCNVRTLTPTLHDEVCALISHMPHLAAAALVNTVSSLRPEAFEYCGPGFRDTTRVAAGLPAMWAEILCSNRVAVASGLRALIQILERAASQLEAGAPDAETNLDEFLTEAKRHRDFLQPRSANSSGSITQRAASNLI
ncbi:MAG: prephenate dehydrogenase/arogenate dehydrogenase family protein [Verrucomicrobia bacterium]|nr:prephenate dehydrogenase/arogenate dehydrogenase family protein [Verrucomicrobiota bacterium]